MLSDSPSQTSNGSQSRIPRYKSRTTSNLPAASGKEPGQTKLRRRSNNKETALREKTSSNINASQKRQPNGQIKPQALNAASMRLRGRHASSGPFSTGLQGTVQHKNSPVKGKDAQGTPDWKRRVLKENAGGDLFSPIGLESVFKSPTVKSGAKGKPTGKRKLVATGDVPSSPPPLPSLGLKASIATQPDLKGPGASSSSRSGLDTEDENAEKLCTQGKFSPTSSSPGGKDKNPMTSKPTGSRDNAASSTKSPPESPILSVAHSGSVLSPLDQFRTEPKSDSMEHTGMFSTQDKSRNENISPFYVSRHNTADGRVEYGAIDMSMQQLRSEMDRLRLQQQNIPSSRSSDHGIEYADSRPSEKSLLRGQMDEVTSQSLPDDLSVGTDAYIANGGFVSIHRGGYSNNGSFQRRPVSPSLIPDLDGPSLKSQSSTNHDTIQCPTTAENFSQTKSKTPSSPPQTPEQKNGGNIDNYERPRSSGSPLKLFDKYDTFTNDRVARRMSKFEQTLNDDLAGESIHEPPSPSPRRRRPCKPAQAPHPVESPKDRSTSSFGAGQLDDYQFSPHQSSAPHLSLERSKQDIVDHQPRHRRSNNSRSTGLPSNQSRKAIADDLRQNHEEDATTRRLRTRGREMQNTKNAQTEQTPPWTATGKRLPYSPTKDPAPKRRRTIQDSNNLDPETDAPQHVEIKELPGQLVHGRKRKDALYDDDRQAADPNTMASRRILQPRGRFSNQIGFSRKLEEFDQAHRISSAESGEQTSGQQLDQHCESTVDPPTQIVAGALASVALNTVQDVTCGSRQASLTTADFYNEAQQIMQQIRANGRPRSSHANTEGSEVDRLTIVEESIADDSTKDEFSRPPSREGDALPRLSEPKQMDARVISHLRKFEDGEDFGLALSSSLKALQINPSLKESDSLTNARAEDECRHSRIESDPPNIRIQESTVQARKRIYSSSTHNASIQGTEGLHQSHESQSTSGRSSSTSNPTRSSRSSTNRMVIAPETVAHLLSDQMAGMVFDRSKQVWVKRKSSPTTGGKGNLNHSMSEGTDEDLLGDIPDLSVNEMEELKRVKDAMSSIRSLGSAADKISTYDQVDFPEGQQTMPAQSELVEDLRPRTADGKCIEAVENSSAPSKYSHFAWSGPIPGTRATSWGNELPSTREPQLPRLAPKMAPADLSEKQAEEAEHEISIFEGRESRTPKLQDKQRQARVITVAFSSPLVDQREIPYGNDDCTGVWDEGSDLSLEASLAAQGSQQKPSSVRRTSFGRLSKAIQRKVSRRTSIGNHSNLARPMSRLDEQDELSLVQCPLGDRHMTMEVALSTPLPVSRSLLLPQSATDQRSSFGFRLTPLSEFTVHQVDNPIDFKLNQVARRRNVPTPDIDKNLSLAAQDLVKKLTDMQPYEPYWDHLRSVDLHDRGLKTLHMFDEFCGSVEELNVSNNQIGELDGIPYTVRLLNLRDNCLSDLAAWGTLQNLQYLDVSNNQLRSLKGFQCLLHLRVLKAENNEMESLNGLERLDGLTSLSLKGNKLRTVDFDHYDL